MKRLALALACLFLVYSTIPASFAEEKKTDWITEFDKKDADLSGLKEESANTVLKLLNENNCTCGCSEGTLANCITHDKKCGFSRKIAKEIITQAQAGKSEADLIKILAKHKKKKQPPADEGITVDVNVENSPWKGTKGAPVTIVEFTDFQCPYCVRAAATIEKVIQAYPSQIQIYFKNNPLPFHKKAPYAALASLAANKQGKYWEMRNILFKNSKSLSQENILGYAKKIGLDMKQFEKSVNSQELKDQIDADKQEAKRVKARGTPHFFVNGRRLKGAKPFDAFKKVIDEELAKLKAKPATATGQNK